MGNRLKDRVEYVEEKQTPMNVRAVNVPMAKK
jgi:hypothetical protein